MRRPTRAAILAGAVACAVACGGDGVIPDPTGGMMPPSMPTVTLTELQNDIFTPRCAIPACHAPPLPARNLVLQPGLTFANTVNVVSDELPQFLRVEPFDPDDSYLFMKVSGDPRIAFAPMPLIGPALSAAELQDLRTWILEGAQDN